MSANRKRDPAGGPTSDEFHNDTISNAAPSRPKRPSLQARHSSEARRLRRQRYARCIWPLGDRVLFELIDHIADRFGLEDEVDRLLDRFAGLSPDLLRALGADRVAAPPIREVRR
jgi:hypothetical protein